ncbi:ISL3 family transposase [Desulfosporosinus fructosivorans]|uniref:ISL3 family transposase n=2 Tax=Desulfosporosinus fructosivorans TaxID=2018669 RepID=A0A4Z0R128_9FIRM|nr:ISL3 family transposase [Desulfosporosinus fructosivorans]
MVCIDDFAIRKRESYGTIMVDIETHRVIDLIPSRECGDVVEWLKTYPNLKVVSRDGSITYHNAITKAHPKAVQVSDRFHILKNLTLYCKEYLMKYFKAKIIIKVPKKSQVDLRPPSDASVTKKKLILEEKLDRVRYVKSDREISHEQRLLKKQELINTVRDMHKQKFSARAISKILQLSRQTVTRYLDEDVTAIHGSYSVKRKSILDPYLGEINVLIDKGVTLTAIETEIRQEGYKGSSSTLRNYAAGSKRLIRNTYNANNIAPENTELVERKLLIKLLYKQLGKVKGLDRKCLDRVNRQYPRYKDLIDIVNEFRQMLYDKNVGRIEQWIHRASGLNIREVTSFINGITRDIVAVKNAIKYEYNNGLAEGSVNKLKVIKRIMYGRNSFELLRKKLLWLEKRPKFN